MVRKRLAALIRARHPAPGNASFLEKTVAEQSKAGWHFTETMKGSKSNKQTNKQNNISFTHAGNLFFFLALIVHQGTNTNRNIEKGMVSTLQEFKS